MTRGMLYDMESRREKSRSVDVTGLTEEAIRGVESLVAKLRDQENGSSTYRSPQEWCKALREWAESHRRLDKPADWSRDAVYSGRGE
jgi:hypothetical protein